MSLLFIFFQLFVLHMYPSTYNFYINAQKGPNHVMLYMVERKHTLLFPYHFFFACLPAPSHPHLPHDLSCLKSPYKQLSL